jgi:thiosulfate dehydrogenase (quinone) large subunit
MKPVGISTDRNSNALAALRLGVGIFFLIFGEYKVFGTQFTLGGGFLSWINRFIAHGAYSFMLPVLHNFVVPHSTAISFAVAYGEFAIGLGLIFGVLTRTAAFFGFLLMLAMLFSSDFPGADAAFWNYFGASLSHSVFAMCFLAFMFGDADRALAIWPRACRS